MTLEGFELHIGDCIESMRKMPDQSVHCCVTSPPYFGLRDYGREGQIGMESTPDEFVRALVAVFREVRRVLRDDGTLWLNLGDSYGAGKQLLMMPARVAIALQDDGWILRQDIVWAKGTSGARREGNIMPESVKDRCSKSHEYVFLLSKAQRYFFDNEAIKEPAQDWGSRDRSNWRGGTDDPKLKHHGFQNCNHPMGNRRSVWRVNPTPFKGAHFATFPPALIEPCILAGCPVGGTVLDPFGGSGTTAGVALKHGRRAVICELNAEYADLMPLRIAQIADRAETKSRKTKAPALAAGQQSLDLVI